MALADVCAAITQRLREIPGAVQVPDAPPPQLADDRMLIVYPQPGGSTPFQHGGRNGQQVMQNRDTVVVEWHLKAAADQPHVFIAAGTPMLDAMRDALWSTFHRNHFDDTVAMLHTVNTDRFGELGWGTEFTWGFRLLLDLTHTTEVSAGKAV